MYMPGINEEEAKKAKKAEDATTDELSTISTGMMYRPESFAWPGINVFDRTKSESAVPFYNDGVMMSWDDYARYVADKRREMAVWNSENRTLPAYVKKTVYLNDKDNRLTYAEYKAKLDEELKDGTIDKDTYAKRVTDLSCAATASDMYNTQAMADAYSGNLMKHPDSYDPNSLIVPIMTPRAQDFYNNKSSLSAYDLGFQPVGGSYLGAGQYEKGKWMSEIPNWQEGDIVTFTNGQTGATNHVGMYAGETRANGNPVLRYGSVGKYKEGQDPVNARTVQTADRRTMPITHNQAMRYVGSDIERQRWRDHWMGQREANMKAGKQVDYQAPKPLEFKDPLPVYNPSSDDIKANGGYIDEDRYEIIY